MSAFEQDPVAARQRLLNDRKDVLDVGAEPLAVPGVLLEDGLRVERRHVVELLQDRVLDLVEDEAQLLLQEAWLLEVAGAKADSPNLVGVGGTDASPGSAEPVIAALLLLELVQHRMPGHDHVGTVRNDQPVGADPPRLHLGHLFEQHSRVEHHAVADDAGGIRIEDARGN